MNNNAQLRPTTRRYWRVPNTDTRTELAALLTRIQEVCRVFPTQGDVERKFSYATIRTAAETIATVSDAELPRDRAREIRHEVHVITTALDDLAARSGSTETGHCTACGAALVKATLPGGETLLYCTRCPKEILNAVREISDISETDVL